MNKLAVLLSAVLLCSCAVNAQFLSGLNGGQGFILGALATPLIFGGRGGGFNGGVGYPIPPPPQPFVLPPPIFTRPGVMMVHRRRYGKNY